MTPKLLNYLCEPISKKPLKLFNGIFDSDGNIYSGELITKEGKIYPIIDGIPRFVNFVSTETAKSFGNEWNHFNFTDFKMNWLNHTVLNTFGSPRAFKGRLIVDAGGGSGAQTKWFSEFGAEHVIMLELSHSVDMVVGHNLKNLKNVDVIQCSIDSPPLRDNSINGIIYCHNVIQHTPSVEKTAKALFSLLSKGGEFVFNCYPKNDHGILRWMRFHLVYKSLRATIPKLPFFFIVAYARIMAFLREIPILGWILEKSGFCVTGDVPRVKNELFWKYIYRRFKNTSLNTFDNLGSHHYQHLKSDSEILKLVYDLQKNKNKVQNIEKYFSRPQPIGCALRIFK